MTTSTTLQTLEIFTFYQGMLQNNHSLVNDLPLDKQCQANLNQVITMHSLLPRSRMFATRSGSSHVFNRDTILQ
jgi:hypothetical protein